MLQTIQLFLLNIVMFACIGIIVGVAVILPQRIETNIFNLLITSAFIGVIIGMLTKFSILLLHRYFQKRLWISYSLILLIAGGLTLLFSYSQDFNTRLIILAIVEPLAFLTMFFNRRYVHRLNDGLKRKQAALEQISAHKKL